MRGSKNTLVIVILAILILFGLLSYEVFLIYQGQSEAASLISAARNVEKEEALASSIRNIRNSAQRDIDAFGKVAISNDDLVPVIENIEATGRALRLQVKTNSIDKDVQSGDAGQQKIRISISVNGSWSGVYSFLTALENLPYRVLFESVNIDKSEGAWDGSIILSLYTFN